MVPELNALQVTCNNAYTALKSACHCVNQNDNATITNHSIQKQRTTVKEPLMGSFKCWYKCTSSFHTF